MRTTYPFRFFEILWAFEGVTNSPQSLCNFYGVAVGRCFFGITTVRLRERT